MTVCALLFIMTLVGGVPSGQESATPEEHFAKGVEFLESNLLQEAEKSFLEALEAGIRDPGLYHNLGIVYQRRQEHDEAISQFREALGLDPGLSATRALLGVSLLASGRVDEGIGELEVAVQGMPEDILVRRRLARAYLGHGHVLPAVEQYREIAQLHTTDPEAKFQLGKAYVAASEWCYSRMVKLDSRSARVHQAFGQNLLSLGDFEAAARAFQRAIESEPKLPDLHLALAQALLQLGKTAEALEAVEKELEIIPWNRGARQLRTRLSSELQTSGAIP